MDLVQLIKDTVYNSFADLIQSALKILPGVVVLLIGWIISKMVFTFAHKGLKAAKFDDMAGKIGLDKMLAKINPELNPSKFMAKLLYFLLMLGFVSSAAGIAGWTTITTFITDFFFYLPKLIVAILIFLIGLAVAGIVKSSIYTACHSIGISGAKAIANIVYYLIAIFIGITAMNQAGINTELITSNLTLIIGSILLAFAISYGFASRNIITNILSSYYGKGKFREGQTIRIRDVEGVIEKIDSLSITIKCGNRRVVMPSKNLVEEQIEIIDDVE
jgi:small-conductance mechanosensitive channel